MISIATAFAFVTLHPAQAGEYMYSDDALVLADLVVEGVVEDSRCMAYDENDDVNNGISSETTYSSVITVREVIKGQAPDELEVVFKDLEFDSDAVMGCGYLPDAGLPEGWAGVLYLEETEDGGFHQVSGSWPDTSDDSDPASLPDCGHDDGWGFGIDEGGSLSDDDEADQGARSGCQVVSGQASGLWALFGLLGLVGRRR